MDYITESVPSVLEHIGTFLPVKDLRTCYSVSTVWKDVSRLEIRRRQYFVPFSQGMYCSIHSAFHSTEEECESNEVSQLRDIASKHLEEARLNVAEMCIAFATEDFMERFGKESINHLNRRIFGAQTSEDAAWQDNRVFEIFTANGIICNEDSGAPLEIEDGCCITSIILPNDPELSIYSCSNEDIYDSYEDTLENCSLLKKIPQDLSIKCLLLFPGVNDRFYKYVHLIDACKARQKSSIAVGGVRVKYPFMEETDPPEDGNEIVPTRSDGAIAFCGENVEAASVVIFSLDTPETIAQKLREFQKLELQRKKCLGFVFRNSEFASECYERRFLESSVFHDLYPSVPLIGALGNGVIGLVSTPNGTGNPVLVTANTKVKDCAYWHTTIFVFVAVKV